MANVICIVVNPTAVDYEDLTSGVDCPAYSATAPITLSDAEVATATAAHTGMLIKVLASTTLTAAVQENIRLASKILRLSKLPATAIT